ncbi:MAG: hypothetical protein RIB98_15485 [Acidimicrobiales bacterium]
MTTSVVDHLELVEIEEAQHVVGIERVAGDRPDQLVETTRELPAIEEAGELVLCRLAGELVGQSAGVADVGSRAAPADDRSRVVADRLAAHGDGADRSSIVGHEFDLGEALAVDLPEELRCRLGEIAEAGLALLRALERVDAISDVLGESHETDHLGGLVAHRHEAGGEMAQLGRRARR